VAELEHRLRELGEQIEFPATPSLALAVEPDLERAPSRRRRRTTRVLAIAFALLLLAAGTAFAVPGSRNAILEWLGLRGVTVERVVSLPSVPAVADLALGEPVSLEEAQRLVSFEILAPELLPEPDEAYADSTTSGGRVSLVYRGPNGEIRAVLTEFRGALAPELVGKLVGAGTRAEAVSVRGGARGLFLSGEPHVFFYRDPSGEIREETLRFAGNTLLWEQGDLLLRLESALPKDAAVRVARSAQPLASR
jgi:hypothetical protein